MLASSIDARKTCESQQMFQSACSPEAAASGYRGGFSGFAEETAPSLRIQCAIRTAAHTLHDLGLLPPVQVGGASSVHMQGRALQCGCEQQATPRDLIVPPHLQSFCPAACNLQAAAAAATLPAGAAGGGVPGLARTPAARQSLMPRRKRWWQSSPQVPYCQVQQIWLKRFVRLLSDNLPS